MAFKTERILYTAKNFRTGLTDVTANIERNGTSVATGVALSEIDAINFPGVYELVLSPAQITTFGGIGLYSFYINSSSRNAPAVTKKYINQDDTDDLRTGQLTIEGKVDQALTEIGDLDTLLSSVDTITTDTNNKVNDGTFGLSALKALIDSVQSGVTSIQNNTRTVVAFPVQLIRLAGSTKTYEVLVNIYNTSGSLEDPDSDIVTATLTDESGNDRGNLISGNASGPINITKLGTGRYKFDIEIAPSTSLEQLVLKIDYTENSIPLQAVRTSEIIADVQAGGLALESTSQEILTDTADMQPRVLDIQSAINSATFGLSAIKSAIDIIDGVVDSNNSILSDPGFGNQALQNEIQSRASQTSVDNIANDISTNVKGAGFDSATDSLKAISDKTFTGGQAI
jgi:hypothetical protein